MPTIQIHKISKTLGNALRYGARDKKVDDFHGSNIPETIHYDVDEKSGVATFYTLNSYLNCPSNGKNVLNDFEEILEKYPRKRTVHEGETPALAYHIIQSFDGYLAPAVANSIGIEFAEKYLEGYRVQISTHTNTDNVHNHIIFACVNDRGERYNDCDATMAKMRKVSDKICEERGLGILEKTKEYKLRRWKDEDGQVHAFEVTPRKIGLIQKWEKEVGLRDDVSSYRNSDGYRESCNQKRTQKEMLKSDIDRCLPLVSRYEDLLKMLQEDGYKIKAFRKNAKEDESPWLAHITFTHKAYSKGVRDSSISEDGFYERKNLEKLIADGYFKDRATETISDKEKGQDEIGRRLNALHFLEENKITNYRAIQGVVDRQNEMFAFVSETLEQLAIKIKKAEYIVNHPEKYQDKISQEECERLRKRIASWKKQYKNLYEKLAEQHRVIEKTEEAIAVLKETDRGKSQELIGTWESVENAIKGRKEADIENNAMERQGKVNVSKKRRER